MKILFLDVETTSKNPYKGAITELAAVATSNGKEIGTCEYKLRPHVGAYVEDEALATQGITRAELENGNRELPGLAFDQFLAFLDAFVNRYDKTDKFLFVAFNAKFDSEFIENWFKLNINRYYASYFHRPYVCTYILSIFHLQDGWIKLPDHKLHTLADHFGVVPPTEGKLHSAMYDVRLCQGIYNAIRGI